MALKKEYKYFYLDLTNAISVQLCSRGEKGTNQSKYPCKCAAGPVRMLRARLRVPYNSPSYSVEPTSPSLYKDYRRKHQGTLCACVVLVQPPKPDPKSCYVTESH